MIQNVGTVLEKGKPREEMVYCFTEWHDWLCCGFLPFFAGHSDNRTKT